MCPIRSLWSLGRYAIKPLRAH
jgi:hypothetical protein